jgi:DNA-binding CsgD family transcriptional regulator
MAQLALGRLRARRGDAGAWSALDEALRLADASGHLQRNAPVRAARAEAAWLGGDRSRCVAEARAAYELAAAKRHPWFVGELAYWQHVAGAPLELPDYAARPYALQIAGDWRAAAAAWLELKCPYEAARALAQGDAAAQREALATFDRLGTAPAADALRQAMRAHGQGSVPRGPRASTRANRFGLTAREMDILALVEQGLTNAQIAARRHVSTRTVDHHVAAILAKLHVASRDAAARVAREQGLLAQDGHTAAPR